MQTKRSGLMSQCHRAIIAVVFSVHTFPKRGDEPVPGFAKRQGGSCQPE